MDVHERMEMKMSLTKTDVSQVVLPSGASGDVPLLHARHVRSGQSAKKRATFPGFALCQSGVDLRVELCSWPANKSDTCRKPPIFKLRRRLAPEPGSSRSKRPNQAKRTLATLVPLLVCKPWALEALKSAAWVSIVWTRTLTGILRLVSASSYSCCFKCDRVPTRVPDVKMQIPRLGTQRKLACQGLTWPSQKSLGDHENLPRPFHRGCCDSALAFDAMPTLCISKACALLLPLPVAKACQRRLRR
ncbi:unnamed protein product [Symbiodinium natans]|uniref:Uncharacterized protein n=1 Tax=Symbiodinium natans TaxID=878477 RepID=A0A812VC57_9DINO|nr:unnamed protein product [Symbiodinium natans]